MSMKKKLGRLYRYYLVLREMNDRVFSVVASVLFGFIYIVIVPWFAVFSPSGDTKEQKTLWRPWTIKSDTLEDVRKQY